MSLSATEKIHSNSNPCIEVGVGLRHPHYEDALKETDSIDFVEIHAENFFASGGASHAYLEQLRRYHNISLHCVSMGLGSAVGLNSEYANRIKMLADRLDPMSISDHASFCWGSIDGQLVHAGDLLPVERTDIGLNTLCENVDRIQNFLGRKILVENISSYRIDRDAHISEPEFLAALSNNTGCGLLIDLNNVLVNAYNFESKDPLISAKRWLTQIPADCIGEYHLAGSTEAKPGEILIDDHAQPVSQTCWQLFEQALLHSGPRPTLIEWDNELPAWGKLLEQATTAKAIIADSQALIRRQG